MKTLRILLTINVPDEVTPEMIDLSTLDDGYFIGAFDDNGEGIFNPDDIADCEIESCTDTAAQTTEFMGWNLTDFESRAATLELDRATDSDYFEGEEYTVEGGETPPQIYDRAKFTLAIHYLESGFDASVGISWDNIETLLNTWCLIDEPK